MVSITNKPTIRSSITVTGPHLSCSSNVGSIITIGTTFAMIALTPSYSSLISDSFLVTLILLSIAIVTLHDESSGIQAAGVNTVLDQQSQSVLTTMIVLIEYLLFAGFCVPLWLTNSLNMVHVALLVF